MRRSTVERYYWNSPGDILALTHDGRLPMPLEPAGMRSLHGTGIDQQVGVMMLLRDEAQTIVGLGSELEVLSPDLGPFDVYFTIVIPGRGAIFIEEVKSYVNPEAGAIIENVVKTGEPWTGELAVIGTCGPSPDRQGVIVGGSGVYAGVSGTMRQIMNFKRFEADRSVSLCCEELTLVWPEKSNAG
jgi:hypothetical protein